LVFEEKILSNISVSFLSMSPENLLYGIPKFIKAFSNRW